jgi:GT2 family glycosyltransferase
VRLSVIIPCFNAADTIAAQLEALAGQGSTYPWEVVVSDNGSTDATVVVVEGYRQRLPALRIVDASARKGAAHARNAGATAAGGDALLFCDADDEVAPGWLEAMGRALVQHDLVAGSLDYSKLNKPSLYSPQLSGFHNHPYLPYAACANLGVRHSLHNAVGGFDETLMGAEDTDYCWKIQLAGTPLHLVPEAVVHYRLRSTLAENYAQMRLYGEYHALLYKRYRTRGMPKRRWYQGTRAWARLVLHLPHLIQEQKRVKWIRELGWRVGRLRGSIKYRVLVLGTALWLCQAPIIVVALLRF